MISRNGTLRGFGRITPGEWRLSAVWGAGFFGVLGTLTALWDNPVFIRMTPVTGVDYLILTLEAGLLGLFMGIRKPACPLKGATLAGLLGFQGFACSICNKILLLAFGGNALLIWYEPYRYWVGAVGILLLLWIVASRLSALAVLGVPVRMGLPSDAVKPQG